MIGYRALALCAPALFLLSLPCAAAASAPVTLQSGIHLSSETAIAPGAYRLTDRGSGMVQVSGSNFTVDFKGAKIVGPGDRTGMGIHITDARNVTIRNADVSGCLFGIVVERSVGVHLVDCTTSHNGDLPAGTVIDESGREPEDNHGAGIQLRDSRGCLVQRCVSQYQWDGIDVVRSEHNTIENGDFSYDGNWGVHLWNSSFNTFRNNRAIWCTTGAGLLYQALTGWQTYDSQAVGIDHNSNDNTIQGNDLRFGGDAIFIRANEGPIAPGTVVPPRNGSHRNRLIDNDCSYSPNNAIEVDLVDDTVIVGNNCSHSNYGMWLGYSRRCIVRDNICIDDSRHAVEIENGQGDLFEHNVFGFDTDRPTGELVYLRQNGRDKTPSGPYTLRGNLFYGAGAALLLKDTTAQTIDNTVLRTSGAAAVLVREDGQCHVASVRDTVRDAGHGTARAFGPITMGSQLTWDGPAPAAATPIVVELNGIPLWLRGRSGSRYRFTAPADFWDRPAPDTASVRVINGATITDGATAQLIWPRNEPRIRSISPNPAALQDRITVRGAGLAGGTILLNGKPVPTTAVGRDDVTFTLPPGILASTSFNLVWRSGSGESAMSAWPTTVRVQVPPAASPHLVSASFSPTTLHVGDLLKVTMTVRNNLPTTAYLLTKPAAPFTYDETQASYDMGFDEQPGTLDLRVSTDFTVGGHDPGSWPWLFGFGQPSLAPGETTTVVGYVRVQTPGVHEYRIGLVAGGFRFIDDNAFRTRVTVLPK